MEVNSVMLKAVCPAPILNWKFKGEAQSAAYGIRSGDIEKVHVSIISMWRCHIFAARIENAERIEITIANRCHPLARVQIGRLFSTRRVTVEGTPTGRQASPRASPL